MRAFTNVGWFALLLALVMSACQTKPVPIAYNPAYDAYLSAFTTGEISKKSSIIVRFASDVVASTSAPVPSKIFDITPHVEGDLQWRDVRTLEFIPHNDLTSGEIYTASVQLDQLVKDIPSDLAEFQFQFRAKQQFINVSPMAATATQAGDHKFLRLQGKVETRDVETKEAIEQVLAAYKGGSKLPITWEHVDAFTHIFTIDSVRRQENAFPIHWEWNGKAIKVSNASGEYDFNIPSTSEFVLNHTYHASSPEQHIVLEFSDALDISQNLDGLVTLGGKKLKYSVDGNLVKIYPQTKLTGTFRLEVSGNIKSLSGKLLGKPDTETITFSDANPEARWVGKGSVIPRSKTMPIIFQTINLTAIDIRVIKIKEDNIVQFFQVNNIIDGRQELKRVGTEVLRKKIDFSKNPELKLSEWTTHSLDLASLLEPEAGAIYEIAIGFRKSYSLFQCAPDATTDADGNVLSKDEADMLALGSEWDKPTYEYSYWDYYDEDYEYDDLKDPCKKYYYNGDKAIRRNVLGSDLGILVKRGDNDNLFVVNNLQTTEPMANVELEIYDYHQDIIARGKTDNQGMAKIDVANLTNEKPFLLIAKSGKQRGYLRLDDGSALSLSRFEVQGANYTKGLKGFIYGERGVWRPGDEMFINFILEDKDKSLPANHPVVFELKDPKGGLVAKRTSNSGVNGFYNFTCRTDANAITGNYTATVKVGGASFSKSIKIETIKPNRLKLALDFGAAKDLSISQATTAKLKATWLHGAIARGLKAQVEVSFRDVPTKFEKYGGYTFTDPARKAESESKIIYEGKLDNNGETSFPCKIQASSDEEGSGELQAAGLLSATFRTQVFEEGGDFSIDQFAMPFHAYNTYVGILTPKGDQKHDMLLTDTKHKIQIATVDKNGNPVSKSKIDVTLYKLDWRWWFDQNKDEVSSYQGQVYANELQKATIATTNGNGSWDLEVKYPEWGRYLIRACDGDGHCAGKVVYIDWPGWAGRSTEKDPEGATALNFTADKPKYNVGETVTLNIPTGFAGRALVTIESNSRILLAQWINANKGTTQFTFQATKDMSPNVYAYVTLLQPHAQTKNDLPIRMYGVAPILVEDPNTRIEPAVEVASELRPLEDFDVVVSEKRGGPMTYTLAIVDEGLLDLTRFKTPSPWETFYQRMALGVKTWDMYNEVLGAFGGQVKSLLSIGGDDALNSAANRKQDRFKPVVLYAGPFTVGKGEKKKHTFKMPNYVGSVRVMVVAGQDGAYGSAEKTASVKQPLMVLATLPRVLSPDEKIQLPVNVFAMKEGITSVDISIQGNELFEIAGGGKRTIPIKPMSDEIAFFEVKAKSRAGTGFIKVVVKGGGHEAFYETEIQVRNPNPTSTNVWAGTTESGQTWAQNYAPIGMTGTNNASLEVSAIPAINLQSRLAYLIKYPYGCLEQTTSSVFPQLYVGQFIDLTPKQKEDVDKNVKAAITRLQRFQLNNGGFGYWIGAYQADGWASNYAGHFLLEAQKLGYSVPSSMLDKWIEYQTAQAAAWTGSNNAANAYGYNDEFTQAYRLFALAMANKADMGAMNRLRTNRADKIGTVSRWYLAAAYSLAGQKDVAKGLIASSMVDVLAHKSHESASTYGSQFRDQAMLLQALSLLNEKAQIATLVKTVASRLASNDWLSTQETAQGLIAMSKYLGVEGGKNFTFEYRIGDGAWTKVSSNKPVWQLPLDGERAGKIEFRNNNDFAIYPRVIGEGVPAAGNETEAAQGLKLTVEYLDKAGAKFLPKSIGQSTNFMVAVTVKNTTDHDLNEIALNQVFPSGWEILNMRLLNGTNGGDAPEYQDIRDDRAYTFFDLKKGTSKTFRLLLNASYLGSFYLPGITAECMYDKSTYARTKGEWVEVIKVNNK